MASKTDCRWFPVTQVPGDFVGENNQLNVAALTQVKDMTADPLTEAEYTAAVNAVVLDIVGQGEDPADASALVSGGNFYVGASNGVWYAFFDTQAGVFVYSEKCGINLMAPWMLAGAGLLAMVGFAFGPKLFPRSGKASGFMGATVGLLAGAAAGYGAAKLATPKYMKA